MNRNLTNNSFLYIVKKLYQRVTEIDTLVFMSSLFFLSWFLEIFFKEDGVIILILFLGAQLIYTLLNLRKVKYENEEAARKSAIRTVGIPGSILFLFLFLNVYLKISEPIRQEFLIQAEEYQAVLISNLSLNFLSFVLVFSAIYFFALLRKLINGEVTKKNRLFWKNIFITIIIFIFIVALGNLSKRNMLPFEIRQIIVFIIEWLFGFSLISLHLNYLIKETRAFLRSYKKL